MQMIKDNKIINYKDIKDIPGAGEKKILGFLDLESALILPVYTGKKFYGLIVFHECRYHRKWPVEDVTLLNTIVQIISGAIERKQSENALRKSEAKYRSYFENSQDIVFINSGDSFIDVHYWICNSIQRYYRTKENGGTGGPFSKDGVHRATGCRDSA